MSDGNLDRLKAELAELGVEKGDTISFECYVKGIGNGDASSYEHEFDAIIDEKEGIQTVSDSRPDHGEHVFLAMCITPGSLRLVSKKGATTTQT